ncbi:hypothetical protein [Pseudomonas savastanoi]|nr:hypothetical protein [Pseudomonas savastanoi]
MPSVVPERHRAHYLHFYVDDVLAAAVGCGSLDGTEFHVHYRY